MAAEGKGVDGGGGGDGESGVVRKRKGGGGGEESVVGRVLSSTCNQFQAPLTLTEKILQTVYNMYMEGEFGMMKLGEAVGVQFRYPRKKVVVMLLGNHSAGKSTFINWYIEETVLKTGVAIETQGFSFVTSGKKRDTLKGEATIKLYPHLKPLQEIPGVMEYLNTEISSSRSKRFNLVTFVDTPGLVDGDMEYPYDVNQTLMWLGDMADLVLVFFDPMGQALCKRTLNILEELWAHHSEKIRLYLAKSDEAGSETDRQKVLMQIVQELCKRPGLSRTGFDMPTIFVPDVSRPTRCVNQIQEACTEIDKVIDASIQNSLNVLEADCRRLKDKLVMTLALDRDVRKRNFKRKMQGSFFGITGFIFPVILFATLIVANSSVPAMRKHIGSAAELVHLLLNPLAMMWTTVPTAYHLQIVIAVVCFSGLFLILSRCFSFEKVIPKRDVVFLTQALDVVERNLEKKHELYDQYLRQSLSEADYNG